jgi:hypothetical protein
MEVAVVGGPLKKYEVTLPGGVVTTMKLNESDAIRYGVADQAEPEQAPPDTTEEPAAEETVAAPAAKKRAPRNKARTAPDKGEGGGG